MGEGRIFFQQDWYYDWQVRTPMADWTIAEKRHMHNTVDRQIWASWSNHIKIPVALGSSPDARARDLVTRTKGNIPINFDIRWVLKPGHWFVTAIKSRPGDTDHNTVDFDHRKIVLHSYKLKPYTAGNDAGASRSGFLSPPHEFGHTLKDDDEYQTGSPNLSDTDSIMNIGRRIRPRHIQLIVDTLNKVLPGCVFSLPATI